MRTPTVHLNGTKGQDLLESYLKAVDKLRDAIQAVMNDPMNKEAADQYFRHQKEMNGSYWDPRGFQTKMFKDPEMQQLRQQEYEQSLQPHVQQLNHDMKMMWYMSNQKAVDSLPDNIRQAFEQGFYGATPNSPFREWLPAMSKAIQHAQQQAQTGQPHGQVAQNATSGAPQQRPPQREPTNGIKKPEGNGFNEKEAIKTFAAARVKERLAQKS